LRKILIVSMALVVSLIAILPALAMATNYDPADRGATRAFDTSFGSAGKAEYCEKPGHPDCDDDDKDDDDKDDDKDKDDKDDDDKKPKKKKKKWKDDD